MEQSEYIAALDLGTSKMVAMAANKNNQGILSIIASEKVSSDNSVRRGYIYNINETEAKLSTLINKLNQKLESPVEKIYVGLGGQSIHSQEYIVKRNISGESIREDHIDFLLSECKLYRPEFMDVLDIATPEYYLDGRLEANPVGVICNNIEAKYQLILGKSTLKTNLEKCVSEKSDIKIAGFYITPLATAEAVLTENEKELGCALVEFGAGVTYVSVYKNGFLRYLVTIPLGGSVITKDICDLNVLEKEAEQLKLEGFLEDKDDCEKLEAIICARAEEIVENVIEQIRQSDCVDELGAGIVITGGGSGLSDLSVLLKEKTGMNLRLATTKKTLVNNMAELVSDPANSAVMGLLALGTENCAKKKEVVQNPQVPVDIFGNPLVEPEKKTGKRELKPERKPEKTPREEGSFFRKLKKGFGKATESLSDNLFGEENDSNNETEE